MYTHKTDPNLYIIEPADLDLHGELEIIKNNKESLKTIIKWAQDFLSNPHSELGREGAVCPFTETSINKNLFWLSVFSDDAADKEKICNMLVKYCDWFLELIHRMAHRLNTKQS